MAPIPIHDCELIQQIEQINDKSFPWKSSQPNKVPGF